MKTTINKINEITELCIENNIHFWFNPQVNKVSCSHYSGKKLLFSIESYYTGRLIDFKMNDCFPIDEMISELKKYIKTLK